MVEFVSQSLHKTFCLTESYGKNSKVDEWLQEFSATDVDTL